MLKTFTWQDFLLAAIVLSLVWYAVIALLFYRKEVLRFLSGKKNKDAEPLPHGWQDEVDELETDLIGKSVEDEGVSVLEADDFSFVPREESGSYLDPLGDLADVQQEIKSICRILEKEDGSKEQFFSLFEIIRNKYPKVGASQLLPQINDFIREQAPFYLSDEELDNLWV